LPAAKALREPPYFSMFASVQATAAAASSTYSDDARNAYQSGTFSMPALRQSIDALTLQCLDLLLSMEAGAMGMTKDTRMRDLFLASLSASNDVEPGACGKCRPQKSQPYRDNPFAALFTHEWGRNLSRRRQWKDGITIRGFRVIDAARHEVL
jgi:hypothetical protein